MAVIKYANLDSVERIASYVNAKLAFASTMPESPVDGQLILYVGDTTSDYTRGGVYQFDSTSSSWELINFTQPIILTYEEFLELPQSIQESGHFIVEDYPGVDGGGTIEGYYNSTDRKFYEDDQYTTEIPGEAEVLYVGLNNDTIYRYDESDNEFVVVGGGNGTVIQYVNVLPVTGIEDIIYGYNSTTSYNEVTAEGFLDTDDNFIKNENTYTAKSGIIIEASSDGINYDEFDSLEYDETNSEFILTYADGLTDVIAVGSTFYWKVDARLYYAGDEEHQTLTLLAGSGEGIAYIAGIAIKIEGDTISGDYKAGYDIKIDGDTISTKRFIGTQAEWNALTSQQKAKFDTVSITDDNAQPNTIPGHEVLDDAGTTVMPQRSNIHFPDFEVADDSTNDITIVNEVPYTAGEGIEITNKEVSVDETRPSTFIGTTAEWGALSATEKNKYQLVNLTDDGETGDEENYSTSEIRTNKKWIDGKPIYRKVFKFTTDSTITTTATQYRFATDITNDTIDTLVKLESYLRYTTSNRSGWASDSWEEETSNVFTSVLLEGTSGPTSNMNFLCKIAGDHFASQPLIVIVEYTKTTD